MVNKRGFILLGAVVFCLASTAWPHCQVPCGIYGDQARFEMLAEHITTMEKSMKEITRLAGDAEKNYNQIVRWVNNKDFHADEFSDIVTYYFMAQRIKPVPKEQAAVYGKYLRKVTLLHEMLVVAMKTKQTTELAHIDKLRSLLADFRTVYFGADDRQKPRK